jgi:hypothetical protein
MTTVHPLADGTSPTVWGVVCQVVSLCQVVRRQRGIPVWTFFQTFWLVARRYLSDNARQQHRPHVAGKMRQALWTCHARHL